MDEASVTLVLNEILADESFQRAPRMSALLTYLVEEEVAGRGDRLTGYKVGVEALRKPDHFDPSSDASVRVETGRLRRMLNALATRRSDRAPSLVIPKGSYRPRLEPPRRRRPSPISVVTSPSSGPAVAVLACESLDDDVQATRFALGLRQELLTELFRYREFHFVDASGLSLQGDVAGRCAAEFECEFMLGIQVSASAKRFRVHLMATDLELDRLIWSERFDLDRENLDILEVSESLAAAAADRLARPGGIIVTAAAGNRLGKTGADWSATDCIVQWHVYRLRERSRAVHARLKAQVVRTLRDDPGFALGFVIYAQLVIDEVAYQMDDGADPAERFQRAAHLIEQSLSIDPHSGVAHYVKAQTHYFLGEFEPFLEEIGAALALQPRSTDMLHQCGTFLCLYGRWETGRELLEKSGMRYHSGVGYRLAYLIADYFCEEDPEPARRLYETTYIPEDLDLAYLIGALIYAKCDDLDMATRLVRQAYQARSSMRGGVDGLARLWFADPSLRQRAIADLRRIEARMRGVSGLQSGA